MNIAILLYDRMTALDAIGPYEVLSRVPDATLRFVATEPGPVRTDNGLLGLVADHSLKDVSDPDVVLVPGGPGEVAARAGGPALEWLRAVHETTAWTTSVCTGSLILAAAGLLKDRRATSHWLALGELARHGAHPAAERVVFDGKYVTAAGVSAGLDMGLALAGRIAGDRTAQAIQLGIEYDPQPPYDAGSPDRAPAELVARARAAAASSSSRPGAVNPEAAPARGRRRRPRAGRSRTGRSPGRR